MRASRRSHPPPSADRPIVTPGGLLAALLVDARLPRWTGPPPRPRHRARGPVPLPVPSELRGCWRRAWIEHADGTRDDTSVVIWVSARLRHGRGPNVDRPIIRSGGTRAGFDDCTLDELRTLADSESSSGHTTCTPVVIGRDGVRRATAEWFSDGDGVAFQPVSAYPEPGLLEWPSEGVMIERAPSGAYVEERPAARHPCTRHASRRCVGAPRVPQRRRRGTGARPVHPGTADSPARRPGRRVRRRPRPTGRAGRLRVLVRALARSGDDGSPVFVIEVLTIPWRVGEVLDVDLR